MGHIDIQIISNTIYRDGGTLSYKTNIGELCCDNRIGTKTRGKWFYGHPNENNSVKSQKFIDNFNELRKEYHDKK